MTATSYSRRLWTATARANIGGPTMILNESTLCRNRSHATESDAWEEKHPSLHRHQGQGDKSDKSRAKPCGSQNPRGLPTRDRIAAALEQLGMEAAEARFGRQAILDKGMSAAFELPRHRMSALGGKADMAYCTTNVRL